MDQDSLLKRFEFEFEKVRSELGFKSTLEEIDKIFYIRDLILKDKFVSKTLSRTICHRIVETYNSWGSYIHSILMPNPSSIISNEESRLFSDKEKKRAF